MPEGIIYSKVRGVTFEGRQDIIRRSVRPGMRLEAIREPQNPHGSTAIGLWAGKEQIGHLGHDLAVQLAPQMDAGQPITVTVTELTGNGPGESIGVNIVIDVQGDAAAPAQMTIGAGRLSPARAVLLIVGLIVVTLVCIGVPGDRGLAAVAVAPSGWPVCGALKSA